MGRGYSTIVHDGQNDLNGQVIRSLNMACQTSMSLCGAIHGFNGIYTKLDEVFRNQMVSETTIINASELENVVYHFKTRKDTIDENKERLNMEFRKDDFV